MSNNWNARMCAASALDSEVQAHARGHDRREAIGLRMSDRVCPRDLDPELLRRRLPSGEAIRQRARRGQRGQARVASQRIGESGRFGSQVLDGVGAPDCCRHSQHVVFN
jgi:hypothetical protein